MAKNKTGARTSGHATHGGSGRGARHHVDGAVYASSPCYMAELGFGELGTPAECDRENLTASDKSRSGCDDTVSTPTSKPPGSTLRWSKIKLSLILLFFVVSVVMTTTWASSNDDHLTARDVTSVLFQAAPSNPPDLSGRKLSNLDLSDLDFKRAVLDGVDLFGTDLSSSDLSHAKLKNARLDRATITNTNFTGADLRNATILRPNIYSSLEATHAQRPIFSAANMENSVVSGHLELVNFEGANLVNATFGAKNPDEEVLISPRLKMNGCNFTDAKMRGANMSYNDLTYANFSKADLSHAKFVGADLSNADFSGANLAGANFKGATIKNARFDGAKGLPLAQNLTIEHDAK